MFRELSLFIAVGMLLLSPIGALGDQPPDHPIKWSQLPNMLPPATDWSSTIDVFGGTIATTVGDDFQCTQTGYIDDVHWWGSYLGTVQAPCYFDIGLWTYVVEDFSQPGVPINTVRVNLGQYQQAYYGSAGEEDVYQYYINLADGWEGERLWQEEGNLYFLTIQAGYLVACPNPNWGWHEAITQWGDDAVQDLDPGVGIYLWEPIERSEQSLDMAFELSQVPEPGTMALFGLGLLGVRAWVRRRKTS
jgi:hypothetical protein